MENIEKPIEPNVVKTRAQINIERNKEKRKIAKEDLTTPLGKLSRLFRRLFFICLWISTIMTLVAGFCLLATFLWIFVAFTIMICTFFLILIQYPNLFDGGGIVESVAQFGASLLLWSLCAWGVTFVFGILWLLFGLLRGRERRKLKEKAMEQNTLQGESSTMNENEESEQ